MRQPLPTCVGATDLTLETAFLTNHVDTSWPRKETSDRSPSAQSAHTPGRSLIAEFCRAACQLGGLTAELQNPAVFLSGLSWWAISHSVILFSLLGQGY